MKAFASLLIAMFAAGLCTTLLAAVLGTILSKLSPFEGSLAGVFIPVLCVIVPFHLYLVWRFYGAVKRRFGGAV
jgi:hypothetical protein